MIGVAPSEREGRGLSMRAGKPSKTMSREMDERKELIQKYLDQGYSKDYSYLRERRMA